MDATNEDVISKLIKLYNSGQSLNLADGTDLNGGNVLPGAVSEILVANATKNNAGAQLAILEKEKERQRQRTNALLERQRANMNQQESNSLDKIDHSLTQTSEVDMEAAKNVTLSIAAAMSRCSKLVLGRNDNTDAAGEMASVVNEDCVDFQDSIKQLARIRRIATAAAQRARPIKKPLPPKQDFFVSEVAQHLRSTTKAKTWSEWELDSNFEVFCNQVHVYETKESMARWLECEIRARDHAKALMEEGRSSSGSLSFKQARAILVEIFSIRLESNELLILSLSKASSSDTISRAQKLYATYQRMAGQSGKRNNHSERVVKRRTKEGEKTLSPDLKRAEVERLRTQAENDRKPLIQSVKDHQIDKIQIQQDAGLSDEQLAVLTLQRTLNQGWKQRFADMMALLDAKDAAKHKLERDKFIQQYVRKAQAIYNLGSSKFASILNAHAPILLDRGCTAQLKRIWNNLFVSGTVLTQLINDCEYFALTHYSKKIQKQWRTMRIRRHFEVVLNRSRYLASLTGKAKLWKAQTDFPLSISGRIQMLGFRSSMKGLRTTGLMAWDQEFAQTSTLTAGMAEVSTLHNRMAQLKPRKRHETSSSASAGSDFFHELHPQAAKWSIQSQYYELVRASALRIQRFWKSVCKRRAFFVSVRYVAAFCILRWMSSKLKGSVGKATSGIHALQVTAQYTKAAAHLAHLIFEKNSLRYQLEGTKLIQNRRALLATELTILRNIQEYQSRARLGRASEAISMSDGLRRAALESSINADERLNKMLRAEEIRRVPRPTIPTECVSQPVGPVTNGHQVFLLQNKTAARQHREYERNVFQWNELQAGSVSQAGLPMVQKLAATALAMQLKAKGVLMRESHDRFSESGDD